MLSNLNTMFFLLGMIIHPHTDTEMSSFEIFDPVSNRGTSFLFHVDEKKSPKKFPAEFLQTKSDQVIKMTRIWKRRRVKMKLKF